MLRKYFSPIILGAIILLVVSCTSDETQSTGDADKSDSASTVTNTQPSRAQNTAATPVNLAPSLPVWSAQDLDGSFRNSDEWIGKMPVVVNFWGTWCPPCRREIPDLVRLYDEFKPQGVEVVSLAVRDAPGSVRNFSKQWNMNWVMLMTNQKVQEEMRLGRGVPTTIFLDRNGKEIARFQGAQSYNTFRRAFEAIL